jgi:glycosyltransferase involved in cell wall biosynthesis
MKNLKPIFVSPDLGRSAEGIEVLLSRLNLYGRFLAESKAEPDTKLIILSGIAINLYDQTYLEKYEYLKVIRVSGPTHNIIFFAIKSAQALKKNCIKASIFIAADLYLGFLASFLITKIPGFKARIQVSIHGSLARLHEFRLKAIVRDRYLKYVLKNSNSIRVVSEDLLKSTSKRYQVPQDNFVIAPVPVDIPIPQKFLTSRKVIGFVGRMHAERGIDEWIEIVRLLSLHRKDFILFIIGDGPLKDKFIAGLNRLPPEIEIHTFGYLDRRNLEKAWGEIKILLSAAPEEGYGLTLREAISTATFVCARNSHGAESLVKEVPGCTKIYNSPEEAVRLLDNFLNTDFPKEISEEFVRILRQNNNITVNALVKSWL